MKMFSNILRSGPAALRGGEAALRPVCGFRVGLVSLVALAAWLGGPTPVLAFPPAPHHQFYGQVRDEMGEPISLNSAELVLETSGGVQLKRPIVPNLEPGVNYRLRVPMDAGLSADNYKATALRPLVPFRIKVRIGQSVYLPIEMVADFANLGKPAESTRLDLTLGEDADGDGLPDAWERALLAALGGTNTLQDITAAGDADGDGISNLDEYLAGTYAFDPADGFSLQFLGMNGDATVLEWLAIRGRAYTLQASPDLNQWNTVAFRIASEGPGSSLRTGYQATDVRMLRVEVPLELGVGTNRFYRALVR